MTSSQQMLVSLLSTRPFPIDWCNPAMSKTINSALVELLAVNLGRCFAMASKTATILHIWTETFFYFDYKRREHYINNHFCLNPLRNELAGMERIGCVAEQCHALG